jgi:hypothetical protein
MTSTAREGNLRKEISGLLLYYFSDIDNGAGSYIITLGSKGGRPLEGSIQEEPNPRFPTNQRAPIVASPPFSDMVQEMKKTLAILNELKKAGLITDYAIGGGMGAVFYVEPFLTYDLDVFILVRDSADAR